MTTKPRKPKKFPKAEDLDLDPDAWPRFEALIKSAAKGGPKPQEASAKPKRKSKKEKPAD